MPDPQLLQDIVDVRVTVAEAKTAGASFSIMMVASEFAVPAQWVLDGNDRHRLYIGDLDSIDEELADHGFAESGVTRRQVRAAMRQTPTPDRIVVGRRDATDASWTVALDAIRTSTSDWYAFTIEDRDATSIAAVSTWAETKFVRFFCQNSDAAVLTATAGNVLLGMQDLVRRRICYLWHDADVASDLGPAVIRTAAAGPWDVSAVLTGYLNPEIDGVETGVQLDGAVGSVVGDAGPYNLAGTHQVTTLTVTPSVGDTVGFHIGALVALTVVSVDLATDNTALKAAFDGNAAYTALGTLVISVGTLVFTAANYATHVFTDDSSGGTADVAFAATTAAVDASAWHYDLSIGGVVQTPITFPAASFVDNSAATAAEIGAVIVAAVGASKIRAGDAATLGLGTAGKLALATVKAGTGQAFAVLVASTAGLLTELGTAVAVYTGTGDMADATAMTPAEVATWLSGIVGGTATAVTSGRYDDYVEIETDTTGEFATARVRGALVNDVLGFPRELTRGVGTDEDYLDVCWAAGRVGGVKLDSPRPQGLITLDNFRPFDDGRIGADNLTLGQRANVRAQGGNTFELRTASRQPGEFHFGKSPSGHFHDTLIGADWLTLRLLEAIKGGLDDVADDAQQIDFSNAGARTFLLERIGGVFDRAVASGILADADMTPPNPAVGKRTGLTLPTLEELPVDGPTLDRFWSGISFVQQGGRALHGAIVRGSVLP